MDAPKFKIPGRERGRTSNDAPNSVKEMSWASQKPETMFDFLRGRFLALVLMFAMLVGGFSVMNRAASRPENQRKANRQASQIEAEPPRQGIQIVDPNAPTAQGDSIKPDTPPQQPAAEETAPPTEKAAPKDPQGEKKQGEEKKPGAEVKAENPEFPRSIYSGVEAKLQVFKEPLDKFDPLEKLDYKDDSFHELYELVIDDDLERPDKRAEARNYAYAAEIMYLYYRFLRTHEKNPEKIEGYYKQRKEELRALFGRESLTEATYANVMTSQREERSAKRPNYQEYRGHLLHFAGLLMQKYEMRVWNDEDNNSGVRNTWLLVCRDLKRRDELYGVLVPHSARHLLSRDEVDNADIVSWKGLFLQRWTYEDKDSRSREMPIYVAWRVERLAQPPSNQGTNWILIVIGGILCLGLIFVFWQTTKDNKQADGFRRSYGRKPKGGDKAPAASGPATAPPEAKPATDTQTAPPAEQAAPTAASTQEPPPAAAPSPVAPGTPPQD